MVLEIIDCVECVAEISDEVTKELADDEELVLLETVSSDVGECVALVRNGSGVTAIVVSIDVEVMDTLVDDGSDEVVESTGIIVSTSDNVVLVACDCVVFENSTLLAPLS